jgi:SAM-dependent methyltransferase
MRGETSKAYERRVKEDWFRQYIRIPGIDIGCQHDPLNKAFRRWDYILGDTDATLMEGVPDESYLTVYASHILEHLADPWLALANWHRILKTGGYLIVVVPHRDLYEKRNHLPSIQNPDHKTFWLPDEYELPDTLSLRDVIVDALPSSHVVHCRVLRNDEYSIECIVRRER